MRNCLVTGAAGFLGSHMVDLLSARGFNVIGVDNLQAGRRENLAQSPGARLIVGDVRDPGWWPELPGHIDHIYHFAANASVPFSTEDPVYDTSTNVVGTVQMLELARRTGAALTYASSAAVYGNPRKLPTDESHPLQPISIYGVSKLAGEGLVRFYQQNHGVSTQTIRFFNCYGPRQPRYIVFDYLRKADEADGPFLVLGDGTQRRTQLYVSDAVEAVFLVSQNGDGAPYNIGSDRVYSVLDIASCVLDVVGQPGRAIECTGTSWPGDIVVLQPSLARIMALGFQPTVDLASGLARVYDWWKSAAPAARVPAI